MKTEELLYSANALELALEGADMEMPLNGFHTVYQREVRIDTSARALVSYIVGGLNDGMRYTVVMLYTHGALVRTGWGKDFRLPVPERSLGDWEELQRAVAGVTPSDLLLMEQVPGFDANAVHKDGWFSRGQLAYELPSVEALPDAKLYRIREGVYMVFPDETYRLASAREFFTWPMLNVPPAARQGDLLVHPIGDSPHGRYPAITRYAGKYPADLELGNWFLAEDFAGELGRHRLILDERTKFRSVFYGDDALERTTIQITSVDEDAPCSVRVEHPEHETIEAEGYTLTLSFVPGVSRPFYRGSYGGDGD